MRTLLLVVLLGTTGFAYAGALKSVHKCADPSGRIHYQDHSCTQGTTNVAFNDSAASGASVKATEPAREGTAYGRSRWAEDGFLKR